MNETQSREIVIKGKMKWGEYKRLVNPETPETERIELIEKYVECDDDLEVGEVFAALQKSIGIAATNQKK